MKNSLIIVVMLLISTACNSMQSNAPSQNGKTSDAIISNGATAIYVNPQYGFSFEYPLGFSIEDRGKELYGTEKRLVQVEGARLSLSMIVEHSGLIEINVTDDAAIKEHNNSCINSTCELVKQCADGANIPPVYEYSAVDDSWEKTGQRLQGSKCVTIGILLGFGRRTISPDTQLSDNLINQLVSKNRIPASDLRAIDIFDSMFSSLKLN